MAQTTVNYARPSEGPMLAKAPLARDLIAGAISGEIAGLIMAAVMMFVFAAFLGRPFWFPVQVIGSVFYGDSALTGFNGSVSLVGVLVHQVGPALFWGLVFGAIVHALDVRSTARILAVGVAIGIAAQVIDVNLIIPPLFNQLYGHNIWAEQVPMGWSWAAHIVYGLSLGVFPAVFRALKKNEKTVP